MAQIPLCAGVVLILLAADQALGQSALERLERQVRNRLTAAAPEAQPAPPGPQERPASPAPAKAGPRPNGAEQAYFGVLTVDALDRGRGVRVTEVLPSSPAKTAGIQPGDLLTGLGGVRIRTQEDFDQIMREVRPGMTLTVEVLRAKEPYKLHVTFGRLADVKRPAIPAGEDAKGKPQGAIPPSFPPVKAGQEKGAGAMPKGSGAPPSAPKIPPPPPEPAGGPPPPEAAGGPSPPEPASAPPPPEAATAPPAQPAEPGPRGAGPLVLGGMESLPASARQKAKPVASADATDTEARLAALEARLQQLEERIARLEEALRALEAARAKP